MDDDEGDSDKREGGDWMGRFVESEFWNSAGKLDIEDAKERWKQIPESYKPIASAIIELAQNNCKRGLGGDTDNACLLFRCMLFDLYKSLKNDGIDLELQYAWFTDGPMIHPEYIVMATNGIIGWTCDSSRDMCGMECGGNGMLCSQCRFRDE